MSENNTSKKSSRDALNSRAAKVGGYSFVMSVFVLAILIAVNVAVSTLPSTWTQFDISAAQLYSVSSATKAVAQNLSDDVTIYWITQDGSEDTVIEKLLNVYNALSDHITVKKTNPDIYPTFAAQYTDETVANNSLIVECGDRYRYIAYSDIYESSSSSSSYYYTSVADTFDGEGEITSAIDYVVKEDLPTIYLLTGHGESDLPDTFATSISKQNIETETFTLLTIDEVPEEADAVLIYAPTSDISEDEADMLIEYVNNGGKLFVMSGPQQDVVLTNLNSVIEYYGIEVEEGIVVEGSRDAYAYYPYMILAELGDSDITAELAENNNYVIVPLAQGLTVGTTSSNYTITKLLTSSSDSFSKVDGYSLTTYDKEDNDIDGPFTLAVSIEVRSTEGMMIWISSDNMVEETFISYSSGANTDFAMNALSLMIGETDSISIRTKSLTYNYLTISASQSTIIKVWLIGLIPLFYLGYGLEDVIRRRKKA